MQWLMPVIPARWEAKAGRSLEARSSRSDWPTWWNPISTKNTKISWAFWWAPVIPATQEAEAGESLEPRRQRLQWAKIVPLHSSRGNRVRYYLKNKTKKLSDLKVNKDGHKKNKLARHGVSHLAGNPNTLGGRGGQITWGQEFETILANMVKTHLY